MILGAGERVLILPCKRGDFAVNKHDTVMSYSLQIYGEFAEDELELLGKYLKPGMFVIDVGANIGIHSVAFSKMVGDKGLVTSFEPLPGTFNLLCANIAFSGASNVDHHRVMVGPKHEVRFIPHIDYGVDSNFGSFNAIKHSTDSVGIQTQQISIDMLHVKKCDLIKIDVEGSEMDVLNGAIDTIKRLSPVIFAECNDGQDEQAARMQDFFSLLEYNTYWHRNRFYRPNNYNGSKKINEGGDRNMLAIKASHSQELADGLLRCDKVTQ